jgi:hypothetical protein
VEFFISSLSIRLEQRAQRLDECSHASSEATRKLIDLSRARADSLTAIANEIKSFVKF